MRGWLRDAALVAAFDLGESVRSRKAMVFLLLYVAGAAGAAGLFVEALREIENSLAGALQVAAVDRPGAMTSSLMASDEFRRIVRRLVGDEEVAQVLVNLPPLALFYGWVSLGLVPVLVVFTSADAIAGELATGSCRFSLFRIERSAWLAGKLGGQLLLMVVGILVGAVAVWVVGAIEVVAFPAVETARWLLSLSLRSAVYGFAWLGLTLGTSAAVRSVHWARGLALIGLIAGAILGNLLGSSLGEEYLGVLGPTLAQLYPGAHRVDLWRPALVDRAPAMIMLVSLGLSALSLGYWRFSRRDA